MSINKLIDTKYLKLYLVHGKSSLSIPIYYYLIVGRRKEEEGNLAIILKLSVFFITRLVSFYSIHSQNSLLFLKLFLIWSSIIDLQ